MKSHSLNPQEWLAAFTLKTANTHLAYAEALDLAICGKHKQGIKRLREFHLSQGSAYQKGQNYDDFLPKLQKQIKSSNTDPLTDVINNPVEGKLSNEALFSRDKFQCRYSRIKLLDTKVLDLLSLIYPIVFPVQYINWSYKLTHIDMWVLSSTKDHTLPKSRFRNGSPEVASNLLTASGAVNMLYKRDATLEELGWSVVPIDDLDADWDGLRGKFLEFNVKFPGFYGVAHTRRNQFQKNGYPSEYADNWGEFPFHVSHPNAGGPHRKILRRHSRGFRKLGLV